MLATALTLVLGFVGLKCSSRTSFRRAHANQDSEQKVEVKVKLEKLRNRAGMRDLDEEYERVYDENTLPGLESRDHAVSAYKLLLCCVEPLSLNALAGAVSFQKGGKVHSEVTNTYILEVCSNFIVVLDGYVQFAHPSAKEYLESRKMGEIEEFGVERQHLQAAFSCLHRVASSYAGILECWAVIGSYHGGTPIDVSCHLADRDESPVDLDGLLQSLQGGLCPEPLMGTVNQSLITKLRSERAYFTVYACHYWVYHAANVSVSVREEEGMTQHVAAFMSCLLYQDWYIIEAYLRRDLVYPEVSDELWYYKEKMSKSCGLTRRGGRVLEEDEVPEPGLLIAAFGLVDLLRISGIAEDFLLCASNFDGETPLHLASRLGQNRFLEEYLKQYSDVLDIDAQEKTGLTPLQEAMMSVGRENNETMSVLLNYGADIGKRDKRGNTVFHYTSGKNMAVAQLLIEHSKKKSLPYKDLLLVGNGAGETALHTALISRHEDVFAFLFGEVAYEISFRESVTRSNDLLGVSLLMKASKMGCARSLQILIESGIPASATISSTKSTALHVADTVEVAEHLLQLEPSLLSKRDAAGMTPLLSACETKRIWVCRVLLRYGADVKARTANGQTPLHLFIKDWRNEEK